MLEQPEDVDDRQVSVQLERAWGIRTAAVCHVSAGHGSANWTATGDDGARWFVKLEPAEAAEFFDVTYRTAADVRDAGLDFVNAAIPAMDGQLRRRVTDDWDMAVFRFVDGRNTNFPGSDRAGIAEVIGRLHAHARRPAVAFDWEPGYKQPELRALLADDLSRPWQDGPYGEHARSLVSRWAPEIEGLFALHDRLLARLRTSDDRWVLTHGEPHDGNTMIDDAGRIHLIDCNAMLVAPAERDLRLLLYGAHQAPLDLDNAEVLEAYRRGLRAGGVAARREGAQIREYVLELFRAEWHLMEISGHARKLRDPHQEDQDTASAWHWLNQYLPVGRNWPALAESSLR